MSVCAALIEITERNVKMYWMKLQKQNTDRNFWEGLKSKCRLHFSYHISDKYECVISIDLVLSICLYLGKWSHWSTMVWHFYWGSSLNNGFTKSVIVIQKDKAAECCVISFLISGMLSLSCLNWLWLALPDYRNL